MGNFQVPGFRNVAKHMPACCANCKHNLWDEYGPHCINPKNWIQDEYEIEEGVKAEIEPEDGEIEWSYVCDNHERGTPCA